MKVSGKRLNYRYDKDGACYRKVKKGLKKGIARKVRRRLNRLC